LHIIKNITIKNNSVIAVCFILLFFYTSLFFNCEKISDTAFFGGDTWEYQSMAVNFAKGYGLKFGGILEFDSYKFSPQNVDPHLLELFIETGKNPGPYHSYRAPGYPFLLGMIYKISGVSPKTAKQVQFMLLIIIAAFLPFIGYYYWNKSGFFCGVLAGGIFLHLDNDIANIILTESFIAFYLFITLLVCILWEKRKSIIRSLLLGLILGSGPLLKGSLIFVPFFFILYAFYLHRKIHLKRIHVMLVIAGVVMPLISWSLYISDKAQKFVFLSTQSTTALLDSNNEYAIKDGKWHPEWRKDITNQDKYFYNKPGLKNKPTFVKLGSFFIEYYRQIPRLMRNKINWSYNFSFLFKILIFLLIFEGILSILNHLPLMLPKRISFFVIAAILAVFYYFSDFFHEVSVFILLAIVLRIICVKLKSTQITPIPPLFQVYFMNFLLITVIFYGNARFIRPMDPYVFLTALVYILTYLKMSYAYIRNRGG